MITPITQKIYPRAILFDLDGVLIETELETFRFHQQYLREHYGIILSDEAFHFKAGRKSIDFFNAVLTDEQRKRVDVQRLIELKRELFNTQIDQFAKKVPYGRELIDYLHGQKIRLALVSQNERRMIESAIRWLRMERDFEIVLSLQDITHKKPNPEIYLLAARRLSVPSSFCWVIEDSIDGVVAAKNAGMYCIGVLHPYTPKGALDRADDIVSSLQNIILLIEQIPKTKEAAV